MNKTSILAGSMAAAAAAFVIVPAMAAADPAPAPNLLAGKTVFLDAGSSAAATPADFAKQVSNGRGGTTACLAPAASAHGVADHQINYAVAKMVEAALTGQGAKVVLSRDDAKFGGCVDQRAAAINAAKPDLAVSINTVGTEANQRGFVLETAAKPSTASAKATDMIRQADVAAGLSAGSYLGAKDGVAATDSVLPASVTAPLVVVNLGNLANPDDGAALATRAGQVQRATALSNGVIAELKGKAIPATVVDAPIALPVAPAVPAAPAATVPAAAVPIAPAQTPLIPAQPLGTGTSPIVAGVPMLGGGSSGGVSQLTTPIQQVAQAAAPQVNIPGLGAVSLPNLPSLLIPGANGGQTQVGLNTLTDMGPKVTQFMSSPVGTQLISTMFTNPAATNSLSATQGPAVAGQVVKSILGATSLMQI
jgi:N-acetylmuramoyl-L-alanine amidase